MPALLLEVCVWWGVCVFSLCVRERMRTREEEEWERKKERTPVSAEMCVYMGLRLPRRLLSGGQRAKAAWLRREM